jgi:glycerol-3-phosphate acyltransferase PlsY
VNPVDVLALVICVAVGYAVGSLPVSALIARTAGADVGRAGGRHPGSETVWKLAGPGWGLLAVTAELSKGVLPVALATVTWSWGAGWAAGLGALTGACWPALGRVPGGRTQAGRGVTVFAVFAGVAFALAPPAGIICVLLALLVLGAARLAGRDGRVAAVAVGIGMYPLMFFAAYRDALRLAALTTLYLVAVLRYVTTRRD